MMYRFISKYQIEKYDKPYVNVDGLQISHPSAEVLLMAGIKPLVEAPKPEYDEEKQYLAPYYEDGEAVITRKWEVQDIPEEVIEYESVTDA